MTLQPEQQQQRLQQFLALERKPPSHPPLRVTNDVSDIAGARPLLKDHVYVNKPHFYDAHDIRGSVSKELHPQNRRIGDDDRFKQLPIEGSTSRPSGFKTNRVCNPLSPEYKLPSFQSAPPLVPKFLRDSYSVTDIQGTSSKKKIVDHPRDAMKLDDIPGSQVGWLSNNKRGLREHPPRDILDVTDIINVNFKSSRITAISAAKSIVFADLIKEHDIVWKKDDGKGPYVIASIGNIGHSGAKPIEKKEQGARRSTAPTPPSFSTNSSDNRSQLHAQSRINDVGGMDSKSSTNRRMPSEKRQSQSLQEEIRLVRELS
uniref:Uncharacterized protein n=1 Tax=Globisporangium ultimum (strain ATCC 200006 / CBS 805.95 / DAOM BR144) TaxID=431595 RepID=K3WP16_GLOUD